jgi:hypothetical protein
MRISPQSLLGEDALAELDTVEKECCPQAQSLSTMNPAVKQMESCQEDLTGREPERRMQYLSLEVRIYAVCRAD